MKPVFILQQNSRSSSDFCVKNIDHAAFGRREIEIAETGKKCLAIIRSKG